MPVLELEALTPPQDEEIVPQQDEEIEPRPARQSSRHARAPILSVSPTPKDHVELSRIADSRIWEVASVNTYREAVAYLSRVTPFAIFCEKSLPDGTWKELLDHAVMLPTPPPVIVTSRLADEYLWSEVLNLGGFDVLAKPFDEREVLHVLESAWVEQSSQAGHVRVAGTL